MSAPERLRETLGGVTADAIADDNLAIHFCSYFEDYSGDVDDCGWTEKAVQNCDAVLDAIHAHYAPTIAATLARAERAEALLKEAVEALGECAQVANKAYIAATHEAINAGPSHPLAKNYDAWRARCMRCAEKAFATLARIQGDSHE